MRVCALLTLLVGCGGGSAERDQGLTSVDQAVSNVTDSAVSLLGDAAMTNVDSAIAADLNPQDGVWVAVGYGGRRMRSLDNGVTWVDDQSLEQNGGDDMMLLRTIVWGNNEFVALGWRVMTSPDGKTWTDLGTKPLGNWIGAGAWDDSEFVALGGYGLRDTSADAKTWASHSINNNTQAAHAHDGLTYGNGHFVASTDDGVRSTSTDGKTWTYCTGVTTATTELAYGNNVFVALGGTAVVVSSDGASFSAGATLGQSATGLVFAQGHFTALASGHVYTSSDGKTWADHAVSGVAGGNLVFGNGVYLLLGGNSIKRSTDGMTWATGMSTGTSNSLEWAAFGTP